MDNLYSDIVRRKYYICTPKGKEGTEVPFFCT